MSFRRQGGDPYWIFLKFHGKCAKAGCGAHLPKGSRAFRYKDGSLYGDKCGHGEAAAADFNAARRGRSHDDGAMVMITRYEITATHPDGRAFLVGYTPRLSRPGLLAAMQNVGNAIVEKLAIGDDDALTFGTKPRPHAKTTGWMIGFTGRTQRDAKQSGELPFIARARTTA